MEDKDSFMQEVFLVEEAISAICHIWEQYFPFFEFLFWKCNPKCSLGDEEKRKRGAAVLETMNIETKAVFFRWHLVEKAFGTFLALTSPYLTSGVLFG